MSTRVDQIYEQFWIQVEAFINEKALEAVDSRKHGTVCHFAAAFSVSDLQDQVLQKNPGLEAPSLEWIRAVLAKKSLSKICSQSHRETTNQVHGSITSTSR